MVLDVYKRQVVCRMSCWALREVEPVSAVTAVGETAWEEKIGSMLMGAYASTPVSYTHLDVYKRQSTHSALMPVSVPADWAARLAS